MIEAGQLVQHDRRHHVGGDFFKSVPEGGDTYIMSHILHDWNDEKSTAILGSVRRAILPQGRLLLLEAVVPNDNSPHPAKYLDIHMMHVLDGKERTEWQWGTLLAGAGFKLNRVVSVGMDSVVEAVPV